jgi:hypothetical protein
MGIELHPAKTILKVLFYIVSTSILVIVLYGYLANMATQSGAKKERQEVELTPTGQRKPSW